jgi:exodeoxyribonuclease VIII
MGLFHDMPAEHYHGVHALSSSSLKRLAQSPAHLISYWQNPPEQTADMRFGSAVHALKHGDQKVLVCDVSTRNTKAYKEMAQANPGAIILLTDEHQNALRVADALEKHPRVRECYSNGRAEVSAFWTCPETGVKCKARADYLRDDGLVVDLKTAKDASFSAFQRSIMDFKYHWQSAHYLGGFSLLLGKQLENFAHIVVEKEEPYGIVVYVLDDGSLAKAREDVRKLKERYAECLHTGEYPGYTDQIQNISLPSWGFGTEVA